MKDETGIPHMLICKGCEDWKRIMPAMQVDETLEDIDIDGETHIYDDTALMALTRPRPVPAAIDNEESDRQLMKELKYKRIFGKSPFDGVKKYTPLDRMAGI